MSKSHSLLREQLTPSFLRLGKAASSILLSILTFCPLVLSAEEQTNEVIVRFRNSTTLDSYSGGDLKKISKTTPREGVVVLSRTVSTQAGATQPSDPCDALYAQHGDELELCEKNQIVRPQLLPNDPSLSSQWWLEDSQSSFMNDLDATQAWGLSTGSDQVVVAILDSGIDHTHPDLIDNLWRNSLEIPNNGIDDDSNGYVDDIYGANTISQDGNSFDDNGHGTHVAGIVGARGNNGIGGSGVNWNVKLLSLKFLTAGGSGTVFDAIQAIDYAIALKQRGVNIVALNNSWGGAAYSQSLSNAIDRAKNAGMLFVVAAGNNASNNDLVHNYPANYTQPNVVTVAATDRDGNLAFFSNYGSKVHIGAPGQSIFSTVPGSGYSLLSGTSMATPVVTGALALLKAVHPEWQYEQLRSQLLATAVPHLSLSGAVSSGSQVNLHRLVSGNTSPLTPVPGGNPPGLNETPELAWVDHTVKGGQYLTVILSSDTDSSATPKVVFGGYSCELDRVTVTDSNAILSVKIPSKLYGTVSFKLSDDNDDDVAGAKIKVKRNPKAKDPTKVSQAKPKLKAKWCAEMQLMSLSM